MISALNVGKGQEEKAEPRTRRVSGFSLCECYEIDTHLDTSAKVNKKLSPERDLRPDSVWRRWRDLNSRAGERPTYRISSADPSTTWVHLQTSNTILLSTVRLIFYI